MYEYIRIKITAEFGRKGTGERKREREKSRKLVHYVYPTPRSCLLQKLITCGGGGGWGGGGGGPEKQIRP